MMNGFCASRIPMGMRFLVVCSLAVLLFLAMPAAAQPPDTVLIQGQLLDDGGNPIAGLRQYRVRFYDAATDGNQLGTDLIDVTMVNADGLFAFPVAMPQAALGVPAVWYELALDSTPIPDGVDLDDVFSQRVRVHSVPFARVAGEALQVSVSAIGDGSVSLADFNRLVGLTGNVQSQLNAKAEAAAVNDALALKADAADVDDAIAEVEGKIFQWEVVTSGPVQMQANRGYVINSANPVSLTLPPSGTLTVGDIVRISGIGGIGAGGWQLGQQANQQILTQSVLVPDLSGDWTPRESNRQWRGLASSADGMKLAAVVSDGRIYLSSDAGATWSVREDIRAWRAIASSADGTRLVAAVNGGRLYTSDNSGVNWTPRDSDRNWTDVASSADGMKLAATVNGGQIYTSSNGGETWTARDSVRVWFGVASSADGEKLVATVYGGLIYTSTDAGVTWTPNATARNWWQVASSADGTRLAATVDVGRIYTSTDSGVTWTQRAIPGVWRAIASSASGNRLVASIITNRIFTSEDAGVTWTARESSRSWTGVAISADGDRVLAGANNDRLYTSPTGLALFGKPSTEGVNGGLIGGQHSAVELQYVGGNAFNPLSAMGSLEVQ